MCSNARRTNWFRVQILVLYFVLVQKLSYGVPELYPFGRDNGDTETARLDDGGSGIIHLNTTFKFFGRNFRKLFVNNNGILTFDSELKVYKPTAFPPPQESENHPIIAPFWADVDTQRNNGSVWYRQTNNATLLRRASEEIRNYFIEQRLFQANWLFIATWERVGFYLAAGSGKQKNNTFQAILVTNGKRSFTIFNYFKIVWTTGSNSGGNTQTGLGGDPAQAGFNAGDGKNYYSIEGAQTDAVLNFTLTSNVGIPGKWVFRVDGKSVEDIKCHHGAQIRLHPQSGSMLGGEDIRVSGPCFSFDFRVYARIYETNITFPCTVINDVTASCITPTVFRTGEVKFQLNPYNLGWNYSTDFSLVNVAEMVPRINVDLNNHVSWNPADVPSNDSKIELLQYKVADRSHPELISKWSDYISNTDKYLYSEITYSIDPSWSTAIFRISWNSSENSNSLPLSIWSSPFPVSLDRDYSRRWCRSWMKIDSEKSNITDSYDACPCTMAQASWDTSRFHRDAFCSVEKHFSDSSCKFRKGASHCIQRNLQRDDTSGDICCYDDTGELIDIRNRLGGGYRTRCHYQAQGHDLVPYFTYFEEDGLPYFHCCQNSEDFNLCTLFTKYRPPTTCQTYNPPIPAQAAGDPHITTLDGQEYTFNGIGDFVLVQDINSTIVIQVRTQQAKDLKGATQNASIFSGVAISTPGFSDIIEIHTPSDDETSAKIIVNSQDFIMESSSASLNGVTLYRSIVNQTENIRVVLEAVAVSLSVDVLPDLLNLLVMVADDSLKGSLQGLLGNFNGDNKDDFISRNSSIFSFNSSMETLHYDFGMTWIVSNTESLFSDVHLSPQASVSHSDSLISYVPIFVDALDSGSLRNGTVELCGDVVQCIFDYQVTGNKDLAKSTLNAVEKFRLIQEDIRKVIRCPYVSSPEGGNVTVSGNIPGANATYQCSDDLTVIQGSEIRICQEDGIWSGSEVICAKRIVPDGPDLQTRTLLFVAVGTGTGGAIILFIIISLVLCCKFKKKESPVEEEGSLDLPTIFPPSNIPCRVFENEAFMNSLQQLSSSGGAFRIPRPSYVDPTIFDEYFF